MSYQISSHADGSTQNLALILHAIDRQAVKVVDIGCNQGVIALNLALHGFHVKGYEQQAHFLNYGKERAAHDKISNVEFVEKIVGFDNLSDLNEVDVNILLSVHHQMVKHLGVNEGNRLLIEIFKKSKRQFFFQPATIYEKYGCEMPFAENDYQAIELYFVNLFKGVRPFKFVNLGFAANNLPVREPLRPLYLFDFTEGTSERLIIPTDPHTSSASIGSIVQVPVKQCRGHFWQSYADTGWHFMRAQIRQLIQSKKQLEMDETVLHRYCTGFAPKTFSDAAQWLGLDPSMGSMGKQSTKRYPFIDPYTLNMPADLNSHDISNMGNLIPDSDAYNCGPRNQKLVVDEINRLSTIYQQLAKNGYQPHLHLDGHIRGKYVFDGNEWVFLVTAGSHRMAVLAELGYEWITARIQPNSVKVIDLSHTDRIPVVSSGLMKQEELKNFYMPYLGDVSTRFPQMLKM